MESGNRASGNTPRDRTTGDGNIDLLAVMRLIRNPARGLRGIRAVIDLNANTTRGAPGTNNDDGDAAIDVPKGRALDAGAAGARYADGAGAHEAGPVGERPQPLGDLVVVGGLLVDADHLLVGVGRGPLHPLPVQVPRDVVVDERAVDVVRPGEALAGAAEAVP